LLNAPRADTPAAFCFPRLGEVNRRDIIGKVELTGATAASAAEIAPPNGLDEIIATFGNIYDYIGQDASMNPDWLAEFMTLQALPFEIPLAWDPAKKVSRIQCHRELGKTFAKVFSELQGENLASKVRTYGGCYSFRSKRTSAKLSTHSWGIAIDLNPDSNTQGTTGDMDENVIAIFRGHRFKWGGDWTGRSRDPMHFQFCTGY